MTKFRSKKSGQCDEARMTRLAESTATMAVVKIRYGRKQLNTDGTCGDFVIDPTNLKPLDSRDKRVTVFCRRPFLCRLTRTDNKFDVTLRDSCGIEASVMTAARGLAGFRKRAGKTQGARRG